MKYIRLFRDKFPRLFIVASALCIYLGLEITNALDMFHKPSGSFSVFWLACFFVLASLVSFIFFAVGSLVWLYARERLLAHLLFAFSLVVTITFACAANLNLNPFFDALGSVTAIVAFTLVAIIMFFFPQNVFSNLNSRLTRYQIFFAGYLIFLSIFTVVCTLIELNVFGMDSIKSLVLFCYILDFATILVIALVSSIKLGPGRKKQQVRIFLYGGIAFLLPLFLLTVVPLILHHPTYSIDGRYTSLAGVIFPLTLGYSVLRYQLLVLDTYIRGVVSFIVGIIALALLVYAEIISINVFLHGNVSPLAVIGVVISLAIFAPLFWWLSRRITDRLLFPEIIRYNRVIKEPSLVSDDVLHVDDVARLVTVAAIDAFDIPQVCFLVLDETSACYQLIPGFSDSALDSPPMALFTSLQGMIAPASHKDGYSLDVCLPALLRLLNSPRPVLLSEIIFSKEERPRGLARVMNANPPLEQDDYLLAPLRSQGEMIGILVLGQRPDLQPYAGPDFEIAQILTGRFSQLLGNARLSELARKHDERQKELDRIQEQFLTVASHELRTPLTAVQGYIELLCEHDGMLPPEMRTEFLEQARIGCDELNLRVNNILDAHLVHGAVAEICLRPISVSLTVLHVLDLLSTNIQRERYSVISCIDRDLGVLADDLRLRQILMNLISNALKYSAPGTRVEISAVQDNMDVQISIRDHGLGVPLEEQQEIFKRFTRLERDMNSPIRGAGLGLYICERFVNAMGGRIWVESSGVPGEGSVFAFVLRCAPMDQAQEVEVAQIPV